MNLFEMRGGWGPASAWLYEHIVAAGVGSLYDRFVAEAVPALPDEATIIDVGCGQGQVTSRLAVKFPRCEVIGLDLSSAMVRLAFDRNLPRENLRFQRGDAMALPFDDESVHAAVTLASIKHWPDRARGVRELLRVLERRGSLCILEADRDCTHASARRFTRLWRHVLPREEELQAFYFRRFVAGGALNLDELVGVLTRAGATEIQAEKLADFPFVVARARKS